jgi:hypothetical protein
MIRDFITTYRQYRKHHGVIYSARIAYGCAFSQIPF